MFDTPQELFHPKIHPNEIHGQDPGKDSQYHVVREIGHHEFIRDLVGEHETIAHEEEGDHVRGDGREHQRYQ